MAVVSAQHHSAQRCCSVATQTDDEVPATSAASPLVGYVDPAPVSPAPVVEYVAPSPAVTFAAPAPVVGYVAPAPAVTYAVPAPVIDYVAPAHSVTYAVPAPVIDYVAPAHSVTHAVPAPVFEYVTPAPVFGFIAPAPAGSFVAPSQQLRPAYADDAAVVVSASQVVGSLPHGEVFSAPVFHQVLHVPLAGGEIPENLVEIPVVVARRPPPLVDVRPSSRAQRHIMEDLGELAPSVQLLDLHVPQMVEKMSERRCPSGTACRRCSPCVTSSERIAGAWVFRSHRSASTVMGSSRLNSLQLSLALKMATSSMLRWCLRRKRRRRRRKTTTTTTSSMGRCLVFLRGSYLCGCAGGSLPGTAGKGGSVCLLTL